VCVSTEHKAKTNEDSEELSFVRNLHIACRTFHLGRRSKVRLHRFRATVHRLSLHLDWSCCSCWKRGERKGMESTEHTTLFMLLLACLKMRSAGSFSAYRGPVQSKGKILYRILSGSSNDE
jgi:hypothetical protein